MRKFLVLLLLAGSASPALAQHRGMTRGEDRSEARSERESTRSERAESRRERAAARQGKVQQVETTKAAAAPPAGAMEKREQRVQEADSVRSWKSQQRQRSDSPAVVEQRNLRGRAAAEQPGGLVEQKRELPPVLETRRERRISRTPMRGAEPPAPATATSSRAKPSRHWRTDWRNDRRYDWRDWRRRHRSNFHFGAYYDPFGWDYFRYGTGWRMWPSYYGSRYWLNDPWMYRLPPAYGPYRWVRYWNDAVLVNIYTGEVVDVVHDFFW